VTERRSQHLMCIHMEMTEAATLLDLRRQLARVNGQFLDVRSRRTMLTGQPLQLAREAERLERHIRSMERQRELEREGCSG
jgi:type IV secretory pathway protease TraF